MSEDDKMVVLGGEVGYEADFPEEFSPEDITSPPSVFKSTPMTAKATLKFYLPEPDLIRTMELVGIEGPTIEQHTPTDFERKGIQYHQLARLMAEMDLDVHDFKQMLGDALWAMEYWNIDKDDPVFKTVDKMHHELGGSE